MSFTEKLLNNMQKESGWHSSPSDDNNHLTLKTELGKGNVVGHYYKDGSIKSVGGMNTIDRGTDRYGNSLGSSPLAWLIK